MPKVVRYIDPAVIQPLAEWYEDGLLPRDIKRAAASLGLTMEKIPLSFLRDDRIATEPWFAEINLAPNQRELLDPSAGFWKTLPALLKQRLMQGHGIILLNFYLEGFVDAILPTIYDYLKANPEIPAEQVVYLTSAIEGNDLHDQWCNEKNIPEKDRIRCWGITAWDWTHYIYTYERKENIPIVREKKFLHLNRRVRPHRVFFTSLLREKNLIGEGLVSCFYNDDIGDNYDRGYKELMQILPPGSTIQKEFEAGYAKILPELPYIVDTTDNYFNHAATMAPNLYERTYFSLVSETFYFNTKNFGLDDAVFFSEKAFKPMSQLHPFILIARPGSLRALRSIGYKTFGKWFDESYDDIQDDFLRIEAILKEVDRLCKLTATEWSKIIAEMKDTLAHNQWRLKHSAIETFQTTDLRQLYEFETETDHAMHKTVLDSQKLPYPVFVQHNEDRKSWLLQVLKWSGSYHALQSKAEIYNYPHPWFYVLSIDDANEIDKEWKLVPSTIQNQILFNKGYLLVDNIHEGETERVFAALQHLVRNTKHLHGQKVILLSGAINVQELYNKFCREKDIRDDRVHVQYVNLFESRTREAWYEQKGKVHLLSFLEKKPRPKQFLCLNRMPKMHRVALLGMLEERSLLDLGYVSCHYGNDHGLKEWCLSNLRQAYSRGLFSASAASKLKARLPLIVDGPDPNAFPTYGFAEHLYLQSYFSVVAETFGFPKYRTDPVYGNLVTDCSVFPTEKIYKPILFGHPFIVASTPHFLKEMKAQGYETFPELFDESYDDIEDDCDRYRFIVNEIDRVCRLSHAQWMTVTKQLRPKLMLNHNRLLSQRPQDMLTGLLYRLSNE